MAVNNTTNNNVGQLSEKDLIIYQAEYTKRFTKSLTKSLSDALDELVNNDKLKDHFKKNGLSSEQAVADLAKADRIVGDIEALKKKRSEDLNKEVSFKSLFNPMNYKRSWDEIRSTENRSIVGKLSKKWFGNSDDKFETKKIKPKADQAASLSKKYLDEIDAFKKQQDQQKEQKQNGRNGKGPSFGGGLTTRQAYTLTQETTKIHKAVTFQNNQLRKANKTFDQIVKFLGPVSKNTGYSTREDYVEGKRQSEQMSDTITEVRDHVINVNDNIEKLVNRGKKGGLLDFPDEHDFGNKDSIDVGDLMRGISDLTGNRYGKRRGIPRKNKSAKLSSNTPTLVQPQVRPNKKLPDTASNNTILKPKKVQVTNPIQQPQVIDNKLSTKSANVEKANNLPNKSANVEKDFKLSTTSTNQNIKGDLPTVSSNAPKLEQPKPIETKQLTTENKLANTSANQSKFDSPKVTTPNKGLSLVKNVAKKAGILGGLAVSAYDMYNMGATINQTNKEIDAQVQAGELTQEQADIKKSNVKTQTISTNVGSSAGALIGGVLGSIAGPIGSIAGAAAGQWLGEKGGELIGNWLSKDEKTSNITPEDKTENPPKLNPPRVTNIPNNSGHVADQAEYIEKLKSQLDLQRNKNSGNNTLNVLNQNNNSNLNMNSSNWNSTPGNYDSYHQYNQDNRKV